MRLMDECRNLSVSIVDRYNGLYNIATTFGEDSSQFKNEIREILKLVKDERILYERLKNPKNEIIQEYDKEEKYDDEIDDDDLLAYQSRVLTKLSGTSLSLGEHYFKFSDFFGYGNVLPSDIKLGIDDVMCSSLEIETLKRIDEMMQNISSIKYLDASFINDIKREHFDTKIHYFSVRNASEFIGLYYEFDYKKVPIFTYEMVKKAIFNEYGLVSKRINYYLDEGLKNMALSALKILAYFDDICVNAVTYYQYILFSEFFETYVSYMSNEKRKELSEEVKRFKINDNLVKVRIKKSLLGKR